MEDWEPKTRKDVIVNLGFRRGADDRAAAGLPYSNQTPNPTVIPHPPEEISSDEDRKSWITGYKLGFVIGASALWPAIFRPTRLSNSSKRTRFVECACNLRGREARSSRSAPAFSQTRNRQVSRNLSASCYLTGSSTLTSRRFGILARGQSAAAQVAAKPRFTPIAKTCRQMRPSGPAKRIKTSSTFSVCRIGLTVRPLWQAGVSLRLLHRTPSIPSP